MVATAGTLGQSRPLLPRCSAAPVRRGGRHGGRRLPEAARLVPRARDVRGLTEGRGVTGHRGRRGTAGRAVSVVRSSPLLSRPATPRVLAGTTRRASPLLPRLPHPCSWGVRAAAKLFLAIPRERPPFPPRSSLPHQAGLWRERRASSRPVPVGCTAGRWVRGRGWRRCRGARLSRAARQVPHDRMPRPPVGGVPRPPCGLCPPSLPRSGQRRPCPWW